MEIFKLGHIFKIKEYENLKNYACALEIKESIYNNKLIEEFFLLVAIREDINDFCLIPYEKNTIEIIDLGTFQQYSKKNKIEIFNIKEYARSKNIYLSWLEAIQINELNKDDNNIILNIQKLSIIYNKIIPMTKSDKSGFLDF